MKNQYFGDNRDLFKYDLILKLMRAGFVNQFTFIPMLTENDDIGHGEARDRKEAKAGIKNNDLVDFLDQFKEKCKRDIKHLKSFFVKEAIKIIIYYGKNKYFSHEKRKEYFEQIGGELLSESLVFVDPDTGLQVKNSGKEHVLYSEVKNLYKRMGESSVLMIFQFISRWDLHPNSQVAKRKAYYHKISKKLKEEVGNLPIYISDYPVLFFFLTKNKYIEESLANTIIDYGKSYNLDFERINECSKVKRTNTALGN